jgi:hypothetical protein
MRHPVVAALLSLVIGFILVSGIEAIGHFMFPPPIKFDLKYMQDYMNQVPLESMLMVLLAHFLGGAVAIFTCIKLANRKLPAYIIAVIFFGATVFNLVIIPHPTWFTIADVTATLLGMGLVFKFVKLKEEPITQ